MGYYNLGKEDRRQGAGSCSSKIKTHRALSTDVPSDTDPSPFLSKAVPVSPLQQQGNSSACFLTPAQLQSISRSVSPKRERESSAGGTQQQPRGAAFIHCSSPHPLYQLLWTHAFPTQAHARHLRVDNLPRQAVNTSHLMLPPRIMCLPVSPVM